MGGDSAQIRAEISRVRATARENRQGGPMSSLETAFERLAEAIVTLEDRLDARMEDLDAARETIDAARRNAATAGRCARVASDELSASIQDLRALLTAAASGPRPTSDEGGDHGEG